MKAMTKQKLLACALAGMAALAPAAASAQLFGPSDEEKAREGSQDSQITQLGTQIQQLETRLQTLEDKVRSLTESLAQATGNNENLTHQLSVMNEKMERQGRDFTYRLCTLSAQQLGADQATLNCGGAGASTASTGLPPQVAPGAALAPLGGNDFNGGAAQGPGRPPGVLGTLPANGAPTQLSNTAPLAPAGPAGGTSEFDTAMNLLAKAQYSEASAAFRSYADNHPDDTDLSPQAIYWVGDIDYVQQNYPDASRDFAELIKKYPKSQRAPDAMLKLGQSLLAMGQKPEGCTTLGALKTKFPDAPEGTVATAASTRKSAACPR